MPARDAVRTLSRNFAGNVARASRPCLGCPAAGERRRSMARMAMPRGARGKFPALWTRPRRAEAPWNQGKEGGEELLTSLLAPLTLIL
jgi:hypothetical protein